MPRYRVTDPSSGKVLTLTGDSPPTEQELNEIFGGGEKSNPLMSALDIATGIGSFVPFPAISIPSRIAQAGFAAHKASQGDLLGAAFSAVPAGFGRGIKAGKAVINTAAKAAPAESTASFVPKTRQMISPGPVPNVPPPVAPPVVVPPRPPTVTAPVVNTGPVVKKPKLPPIAPSATSSPAPPPRIPKVGSAVTPGIADMYARMAQRGDSPEKIVSVLKRQGFPMLEIRKVMSRGFAPTAQAVQKSAAPNVEQILSEISQQQGGLRSVAMKDLLAKTGMSEPELFKELERLNKANKVGFQTHDLPSSLGPEERALLNRSPVMNKRGSRVHRVMPISHQKGMSQVDLLMGLAGGLGGAALGGAIGASESEDNKLLGGLTGAVLGGVSGAGLGFGAARGFKPLAQNQKGSFLFSKKAKAGSTTRDAQMLDEARRVTPPGEQAVPGLRNKFLNAMGIDPAQRLLSGKNLDLWRYASMLSKPSTWGKMIAGAVFGGGLGYAGELAVTGRADIASRFVKIMMKDFAKDWGEILRNPNLAQKYRMLKGQSLIDLPESTLRPGILTFPTRVANAADGAVMMAWEKAGLPLEELAEVRRFMLSGEPTSAAGKSALKFFRDHSLFTWLVPFPRVGIQSVERGIEFSPLGFSKKISGAIRGNDPISNAQRLFRARAGTGVGALGGTALQQSSDIYSQETGQNPKTPASVASAFAGPANLPTILGFIVGDAIQKGRAPASIIDDVLTQIQFELPSPDVNEIERLLRLEQFIPGILGTAADIIDPTPRTTRGQGWFAPIKRRVPGLKSDLPPAPPFG